MTLASSGISAVTLFVADVARAKEFYNRAFDVPVHFEDPESVVFRFGDTLLNLLDVAAAPEVVEPASVGGPDGGVRFMFTLTVEDVDGTCDALRARGVTLLNGPVDRPWGVRTASFCDPDGHVWEIAR